MTDIKIGIVTASDRARAGVYEDISGPAIIEALKEYLVTAWEPVYRVIADDQEGIDRGDTDQFGR